MLDEVLLLVSLQFVSFHLTPEFCHRTPGQIIGCDQRRVALTDC